MKYTHTHTHTRLFYLEHGFNHFKLCTNVIYLNVNFLYKNLVNPFKLIYWAHFSLKGFIFNEKVYDLFNLILHNKIITKSSPEKTIDTSQLILRFPSLFVKLNSSSTLFGNRD